MKSKPNEEMDNWGDLGYFLGRWTGSGTGKPGASSVERSYALVLAGQIFQVKDRALSEPQ